MARQPEVFVRELDPAEAKRLVKITRTARDRVHSPVGAENLVTSCDPHVFVDEAAEPVSS
jgi:hypothetical protein